MARLRKIQVTAGVAWVEAPEANLRVLCGCPADVVKHLMRRGLIAETCRAGVTFETGPNAILLSDVMLQNGVFCNLAEFPVLQMLYRQGMLLPEHPNNTGEKPALIGLREQVEGQLHYIHRGNYGLLNREEVIAAGANSAMADDLLALKLKFAFGRIRDPGELLDAIHLGEEPIELRGGVLLRRTGLNVFEFRLGDQRVPVDLNLPPGHSYEPPHRLMARHVERERFAVIHSGEGDGWDPDRPSMGSVLSFEGRIYLIDCGPNIRHTLHALGIGVSEVEGLFHTHCHDDHFAGLTTLLRTDRRINYYATPLVRSTVMKKLSALLSVDEEHFSRSFNVCDLTFDRWNNLNGLEVKPLLSPHPVENSIFIFRARAGEQYRSYGHFADIVALDTLAQMVADDGGQGISGDFYRKVAADYGTPVDIKKLDIGGGLIHGAAEDFRHDRSGKVILAHLARPLTAAEKEIGCDAPFGTADVLIHEDEDYGRRSALEFLGADFPNVGSTTLEKLLTSPLKVFDPGATLLGQGETVASVFLIISGIAERIEPGSPGRMLSAGSMIGEWAGIEDRPADETWRAASFVSALAIPIDIYRVFVRQNGLQDEIVALQRRRAFLRSTWLCDDAVTDRTLNRLAKHMVSKNYSGNEEIDPAGWLAFVKSGCGELVVGEDVVETLRPGDFFGEEESAFGRLRLFRARSLDPMEVYLAPPEQISLIPVMRWKLLEAQERRMHVCVSKMLGTDSQNIQWRDEYSVNVRSIDSHHKIIFVHTDALLMSLADGGDRQRSEEAFRVLLEYTRCHFEDEERLMKRHGCPDLGTHRAKHRRLMDQAEEIRDCFTENGRPREKEVPLLIKQWIVKHILEEDRRMARLLNARGIY